jgi:hypothetical protein
VDKLHRLIVWNDDRREAEKRLSSAEKDGGAGTCKECSVENGGDGNGTAFEVGPDGEPAGKPCPSCRAGAGR